MTLAGRTALLAGASGGIGREVAELLAGEGVRVIAASRSAGAVSPRVAERGGYSVSLDLGDAAGIGRMACELLGTIGRGPDLLINAAGDFALAPIVDTSAEMLDRQLAANLRGPILLVRALLPAMLELEAARIIQVGSIAGRVAFPGNAAYSASKFGLRGFHEVLVEETRGSSVGPTLLEPAATDTAAWDDIDPDSDPQLPDRGSMLSPADVARAIIFVATRPAHVRIPYLPIQPA